MITRRNKLKATNGWQGRRLHRQRRSKWAKRLSETREEPQWSANRKRNLTSVITTSDKPVLIRPGLTNFDHKHEPQLAQSS